MNKRNNISCLNCFTCLLFSVCLYPDCFLLRMVNSSGKQNRLMNYIIRFSFIQMFTDFLPASVHTISKCSSQLAGKLQCKRHFYFRFRKKTVLRLYILNFLLWLLILIVNHKAENKGHPVTIGITALSFINQIYVDVNS